MTRAAQAQDPPTPAAGPLELESAAAFTEFVSAAEPRLRRALVAAYGFEEGREATAEALAYAWEHWDRLRRIDNLAGYLFRVGQTRRRRNRQPVVFAVAEAAEHRFEPALPAALATATRIARYPSSPASSRQPSRITSSAGWQGCATSWE